MEPACSQHGPVSVAAIPGLAVPDLSVRGAPEHGLHGGQEPGGVHHNNGDSRTGQDPQGRIGGKTTRDREHSKTGNHSQRICGGEAPKTRLITQEVSMSDLKSQIDT